MNAPEKDTPAGTPAAAPGAPAPKGSPKALAMAAAGREHWIPFAIWLGLMAAVQIFHLSNVAEVHEGGSILAGLGLVSQGAAYAARVVLAVAALALLRPWRHYPRLDRRHLLPAILVGAAVFVLWVGFETAFVKRALPALAEFYERWCVLPIGAPRDPAGLVLLEVADETAVPGLAGQFFPAGAQIPAGYKAVAETLSPFDPACCGWGFSLVRLLGSAFVISVVEEFFWRGFLYRWIQNLDFLDIDPGKLHLGAFLGVALLFGAEHREWLAGVATGLLYGLLYVRTRDIWAACVAHVTTNLLLGVYVLAARDFLFW